MQTNTLKKKLLAGLMGVAAAGPAIPGQPVGGASIKRPHQGRRGIKAHRAWRKKRRHMRKASRKGGGA